MSIQLRNGEVRLSGPGNMEEYRLVWFQHLHKAAGTYVIRRAIANGERLFPNNENGNPCNHNGVIPLWEMSERELTKFIDTCQEIALGPMVESSVHEGAKLEREQLKGGKGGKGNINFKTSRNQTPRYAQSGIPGLELTVILELKILADVGLVGYPNAGKSTLLSVITDAKPKIGNYEFTTLKPNLGIVNYKDFKSFVMADIPGIIEGASDGKGLGHYFLRHIERNSTLLFMIPADSNDIVQSYSVLLNELKKYNPELLDKCRLIAITKSDLLDDELEKEIASELGKSINVPFIFISSITNVGLSKLKDKIWKMLN